MFEHVYIQLLSVCVCECVSVSDSLWSKHFVNRQIASIVIRQDKTRGGSVSVLAVSHSSSGFVRDNTRIEMKKNKEHRKTTTTTMKLLLPETFQYFNTSNLFTQLKQCGTWETF